MKKIFIPFILCLTLMSCGIDSANKTTNSQVETTPELTVAEQDAYQLLLTTSVFASTAVVFAGSAPMQAPAFQELLKSEHATTLFSDLQKDATLAGQLYGLCGLYLTDKEHFDDVIVDYQNSHSSVQTFFGCIVGDTPLTEIVPSIVDGRWPIAYKNCVTE